MTVTDSSILVIDNLSNKEITYDLSGNFISEKQVLNDIWSMDIFSINNTLYYWNNYSNSNKGKYLLFSRAFTDYTYKTHLPFDKDYERMGLNGSVYSIYNDNQEALIIYSGNEDIIYKLNREDNAIAEWKIEYKDPRAIYSINEINKLYEDNSGNAIIGLNSINATNNYLFLNIKTVKSGYNCLYNTKTKAIRYSEKPYSSGDILDDMQIRVKKIIDNKIIDYLDAADMLLIYKYVLANKDFKNKDFESRVKEVVKTMKEDDNPILFIYTLKE
ncbi:hypothetical protein M2138_000912 [Dysgonomonadaceae bacterium PH5-43]|nr:hypothetical protein [Dysgonomonadaceae bacterium PH5-43]